MWKLDESYFYQLKNVAINRLSPGSVIVYLVGLCLYSFVILGVSTMVLWGKQGRVTLGETLNAVYFSLLIIFLILAVYLSVCLISEKFLFKSQKFATVVMVVYTLVMSIEPFFLLYLFTLDGNGNQDDGIGLWFIVVLIVGCIQFVMYFILVRSGIKNGSMKEAGKGLFSGSSNLKWRVAINGICFIGLIIWLLFIDGSIIEGCVIYLFLFFVFIVAVQEFIVLAICRCRFQAFAVTYEEATKYRMKRK
ncbi:hypothetical protein HCA69_09665 [Listeria grandensis]|uniref:Uncharacterized protein n=1 Tax=Listeria grandensis TaxID=1494963 RepID=A0A7X0Y4I4_9LIST|nr:hypothetical protein [Listeria grandensis]MBC1936633.1 hypothetical protein [Listeria grandensis]